MPSQEEQKIATPTDPASALPLEFWELVLEDIPPSQLTVLAQASRAFAQVVRGLSTWQIIWNKAQLSRQGATTQHQDFYEAVLASSKYICEGCYCYSKTLFRNGSLKNHLKISKFTDTRYLCDSCECSRLKLQSQRREYLENSLKLTLGGKKYNTKLVPIEKLPYILSGYHGDILTTVDFIAHKSVHIKLERALPTNVRKSKLAYKLQERGIQLRKDSWQCKEYIRTGGPKSVDEIVEAMIEMNWLHRKTQYGSIRGRMKKNGELKSRKRFSRRMKQKALTGYIYNRLKSSNQWSHVQDDPDTPARPPKSLWYLIEELTPSVCVDYAVECIALAPSSCHCKIHTFTDEQLIQKMDNGAKIARRHLSPYLQFSAIMKQFLGEVPFH